MTAEQLEKAADRAAGAGQIAEAAHLLEQACAAAPDRAELWGKLSAMRRAGRDISGALAAIDRLLALKPLDFGGLLARAMLLEQSGDPQADFAYTVAAAQAPGDKEVPAPMARMLAHARSRAEAYQAGRESRMAAAAALPEGASGERLKRFISNAARRTRHYHQEPTDFHYPGLPEIEFHDPALFPELADLEAAFPDLLAEFHAVVGAEAADLVPYVQYPDRLPLEQWRALNNNPAWTAIHLLRNGERVEANARHCPRTMALLERLPQPHVPSASPNAMFSLLRPHTRIPAHVGVANTRLVCHLPLIVPPDCGFRVGATTRAWEPGSAFVFDDTIEHEAWNDSGELRVVFICDLWPPALGPDERDALSRIIPAAGTGFSGAL